MKAPPKIGDTAEIEFVVDAAHVIDFADDDAGRSEHSVPDRVPGADGRKCLTPVLEVGEQSVGVHVDVRHLRRPRRATAWPAPRVINVEGSVVSFQVEARDDRELIARGLHKRRVIRAERFAARLRRKENPK